jgi:hypothetical protein
LYCGKEIGAFRLLKDREFCRPDHRKKYGSRLDRALHQLAAPEPPPAGIAEFVLKMPLQSSEARATMGLWMRPAITALFPLPTGFDQPVNTTRLPNFALNVISDGEESSEPAVEAAPPAPSGAVRAPEPEPVCRFLQAASATEPAPCAIPVRFAAALHLLPAISTPRVPGIQTTVSGPAAEPVWDAVQASSVFDIVTRAHAPQLPVAPELAEPEALVEREEVIPAACSSPMRAPQAEPVWSFVQPVASLIPELRPAAMAVPPAISEPDVRHLSDSPAEPSAQPEPAFSLVQPAASLETTNSPAAIQLPKFMAEIEPLPLPDASAAPSLRPEPVCRLVLPVAAFDLAVAPAAIRLPGLKAEVDPMPVVDELADPPEPCVTWMQPLAAEPVFAFLRASSAGALAAACAVRQPGLASLSASGPHIPTVLTFRAAPSAEPVMAGVWPHVADIPFEPILSAAAIALPKISALRVPAAQPRPTTAVVAPAAEAAETLISASESSMPLAAGASECALPPEQMAPAALRSGPQLAAHVEGLTPEALETILTASAAVQIKSAPVVRLQPFAVAASEGRALNGFDAPRLAPPATQLPTAVHKVAVMPLPTIRVTAPQPEPQRLLPSIPTPGLMPLEFHAQQVRGKNECKLEWRSVRFSPLPPRFCVRPVWEKSDLAVPRPVQPKSTVADVFAMPEAKPKGSKFVAYAIKIAAGLVVVAATWYGATSIKMDRSLQVRASRSSSGAGSVLPSVKGGGTSVSSPAVASAARPESKGMLASMRESIGRRAAVQISDNLKEGMEAWGATAKAYPAGWSHNSEGYVRPGALALLSPTKTFTDYRLEFFGQIESKAMSWTVRAKDEKNYHAMKFSVIEAGLRPVIAMVHYDVINGKAGRKLQTPLNIMVHNNQPIQVAVNVKGNHFVTSVDGEEVDSYSGDAPASGGIGFFADAGEKARLYWVKVSKNDDWLGHVCAFLSGVDAAPAGAELWAPELPGSPAPFQPDSSHASLAGAWIAAPFARITRRARLAKARRYQEWNS